MISYWPPSSSQPWDSLYGSPLQAATMSDSTSHMLPALMDALKKPLRIPPDFSTYAEEKELFPLLERLLHEVLVSRPADPCRSWPAT